MSRKFLKDHRVIGKKQGLFFFDGLISHGSCFFLPRGAHIYNKLIEYLRAEYKIRDYRDVITPNLYAEELWRQSGHWEHYANNMIKCNVGSHQYSLKPMNCPAHCQVFKQLNELRLPDFQLPLRLAEFGVLHRNELSGALMGLTRSRRFLQDDGHIFCLPSQVKTEIADCLYFTRDVYKDFDLDYQLELSLRPEKYLGDAQLWDQAEQSLREALETTGSEWEERKFEGAFYGPKIDVIVKDSSDRLHQCATIQLDFQLPERFDLNYQDGSDNQRKRPVIIHRAIFGSIERFMSMLTEHCQGRWPFWLSPIQAQVIPIHPEFNSYAQLVSFKLVNEGFKVDANTDVSIRYKRKIRDAQEYGYNLVIFVGRKEAESETVYIEVDHETKKSVNIKIDELSGLFRQFETRHVKSASDELNSLF